MDGDLVGLPVLISNPSVDLRGRRPGAALPLSRSRPAGGRGPATRRCGGSRISAARARGAPTAPGWSASSRAACRSPSASDPRERWWRLIPLQTRLGVLELRARNASDRGADDGGSARGPADLPRPAVSRDRPRPRGRRARRGAASTTSGATASCGSSTRRRSIPNRARASPTSCWRAGPTGASITCWRRCRARAACAGSKSRIAFGRVVPDEDQGTLASLGPSAEGRRRDPPARQPRAVRPPAAARRPSRRRRRGRSPRSRRTWTRPSTTRSGATTATTC